jgi:MYXO-CTERM domain-containing protein
MRWNILKQALVGSLVLTTAAVATPVRAQAQDVQDLPTDRHDNDGFDKGLLGLLGLAGLLGLRRRDNQHHVDRSEVNRSATSRV